MRALLLLSLLLAAPAAFAQRGVPQNGFPSWQERTVQVLVNRTRADPTVDPKACTGSTALKPLMWLYPINRSARFQSTNLEDSGQFMHNSPCVLASNLGSTYLPSTTCDGSVACACSTGAITCTKAQSDANMCAAGTFNTAFERMALFSLPTWNSLAENIAYSSGYVMSPTQVHSGWMNSAGHCANVLGGFTHLGVGFFGTASTAHWTENFLGQNGVNPAGTLIAGSHDPQFSGGSVAFRVNYWHASAGPQEAKVNIEGTCSTMTLERGTQANGTWLFTQALSGTSCRRYVFTFKDSGGATVTLPETGSYGVGGSLATCPDWSASAPPACPGGSGDLPPTIADAATATPSPVTGTTTQLTVLGADDGGEAALRYTWAASGPATVTFSANGTNAAKSTVATFTRAGDYVVLVSVLDGANQAVTSTVNVTVEATPTALTVSPATASVATSGTQAFTAAVRDQFAQLIAAPGVAWSVSGGGTMSATGVFTAGASGGGPWVVTATSGSASGTAQVTVVSGAAPTVATAAAASPTTVTGSGTTLSALGADDGGEGALTYTWAATGPATVSYSANGTNGAKSSIAFFTRAGSYTFTVSIRDAEGLTVTSSVVVTVQQVPSSVAISPPSATVSVLGSQTFTALVTDQFSQPIASPSVTWSVTGGGTISAAGVFTAGGVAGGPYVVEAASGAASGVASVTVTNSGPTIATAAAATPSPVTGATTAVSALGADDGGEAALLYTWTATGPAVVFFSPNGTNAAKASTASFTRVGTYSLTVTVRDAQGQSATSSVTVTVQATATTLSVSPNSVNLAPSGTQTFTAAVTDQFGQPMTASPSWSVSGGGSISSSGVFTAGSSPGGPHTVTATLGSLTANAQVSVTAGSAPTVATAASATPSPVMGTTTALSVLGSDDGGEAALTYTWAATGPAAVTYSVNGSNAAKGATATFLRAGTYVFTVTVRDAQGLTVTSSVTVVVNATPTTVAVSPATATLIPGATQAFSALVADQFAQPLAAQPSVTWSTSGGGSISASGVFTAGSSAGGPHTITATAGSVSGTAQVTIGAGVPPTIATAASATPNPVTGTTTALAAFGADDQGEASLGYTWSATGPAAVTFSANGSNAAKSATATFTKAGTYVVTVTVRDVGGLTATSQVTVTVEATPTLLAVAPASATVAPGQTATFTASVTDQFGDPLTATPQWTVSGGGTIDAAGVFTAGATTGGPHTVTATAGTLSATAQVTVSTTAPPALQVQLTQPDAGAQVWGVVTLAASTSDDARVTNVAFLVDGVALATDSAPPWTVEWNTALATEGPHRLSARATEGTGATTTSAEVTVTVSYASPTDTTPPVVALDSPSGTVTGDARLRASASDDVGVVEVVFELDGAEVARLTAAPWAHDVPASALTVGAHQVRVTARDAAGNQGSDTGSFTVPEPPPAVDPDEPVGGGCGCSGVDGVGLLALVALGWRRRRR